MRLVARVMAVAFLFLSSGSSVWADQVVTIYFAGTGLTEEWWDPAETSWGHHEELLATLHREQLPQSGHYKLFVDGIGTGCGVEFIAVILIANENCPTLPQYFVCCEPKCAFGRLIE